MGAEWRGFHLGHFTLKLSIEKLFLTFPDAHNCFGGAKAATVFQMSKGHHEEVWQKNLSSRLSWN